MTRTVALLLLAALAGCANGGNCARPGLTVAAALECRASGGDRLALLELGQRFEVGAGVTRDLERAASLYAAAAAARTGWTYVYTPAIGKSPAMVMPIRSGPAEPGLPAAMYRLALLHLRGAGVAYDLGKAEDLLRQAAARGYGPAAAALQQIYATPKI